MPFLLLRHVARVSDLGWIAFDRLGRHSLLDLNVDVRLLLLVHAHVMQIDIQLFTFLLRLNEGKAEAAAGIVTELKCHGLFLMRG